MQLKVIKADDSQEQYLHTKVIATFVNAFTEPVEKDAFVACQLAEAVTFYLYNNYGKDKITSSEILSIIQAVLSSTGYDNAAANLAEHCYRRNLLRTRVEIIKYDIQKISDSLKLQQVITALPANHWNKSKIVNDLITEYSLDNTTARTIASMVEEKILNSGFRRVPTAFISFLVLLQTQAILSAQQQLQAQSNVKKTVFAAKNNAVTDERLRQPQNGLCPVEV
jgi:transcriptional regulator NrdR family protein